MKVMVIGLDGAVPGLVFENWFAELPTLRALATSGMWGGLTSTHPPVTVPAWSSMMSGLDPGELGFYGFRNRRDYTYTAYTIANATAVRASRIWDLLSAQGKRVTLLGVPQTYPVKPVNGYVVSDFLTPSVDCTYTYPSSLKGEIERIANGYVFDVSDFRTPHKEQLLERIYAKTDKHFRVARHLVSKPWDFFMMVEMGVDRIQHAFWSYCDPHHRKYRAGSPFESALKNYYRHVDREIGNLLSLGPKDIAVIIVSDHGAKRMDGGICINEWLMRGGYLKLHHYPSVPTPLDELDVDWDHTLAWGEGGYHGRLCLNVKGREPRGVVERSDYERLVGDLVAGIEGFEDPEGRNIGSRAFRPEELYRGAIRGIPPDLTVYFGDLSWRSVGSLGLRNIYTFENDTGPDEANHDWQGIFIANRAATAALGVENGRHDGLHISQVAQMVLRVCAAVA